MKILTHKRILIISPEAWDHNFLSKHHYALALSQQANEVFFLNPPSRKNSVVKKQDGLYVIDYKPLLRGINRLPAVIAKKILQREVKRMENNCGGPFEVVWSFDPYRFQDLSMFRSAYRIYYAADWHRNKKLETRIAATAELILSPSEYILQGILSARRKVKINHGVADYFFAVNQKRNFKLPGQNESKIVYVGNLQAQFLDLELITQSVRRNKTCDFIFVGEARGETVKELKKMRHVYFMGRVDNDRLPEMLLSADILLLCYDTETFWKEASNAHKIMEYLAIGKVVVSTRIAEYIDKPELISMPAKNKLLPEWISTVVANLNRENDPEQIEKRSAYARSNTYPRLVAFVDQLLIESGSANR